MTLREFALCAELIWSEMPAPLREDLPGGLIIAAEAKLVREPGDEVVLGEYQQDVAGRRIVLYYGSFCRAIAAGTTPVWEEQIRKTIRHELRHHIEARAGRADLAREEWRERRTRGD